MHFTASKSSVTYLEKTIYLKLQNQPEFLHLRDIMVSQDEKILSDSHNIENSALL